MDYTYLVDNFFKFDKPVVGPSSYNIRLLMFPIVYFYLFSFFFFFFYLGKHGIIMQIQDIWNQFLKL